MQQRRMILFLSAVGAAAIAVSAQTYNLKGRVLEKAALKPVPGAIVTLAGGILKDTTDAEGRFALVGAATRAADGTRLQFAAPFLRDGALHFQAVRPGQSARVELFGLAGGLLLDQELASARSGWNTVELPAMVRGFSGFARITSEGASFLQRVLALPGVGAAGWAAESRPTALEKSAAGSVEVTCDRLVKKTAAFTADNADLGDIVLDYPPRKLDVGAPPVYGALVLFDGAKGKAAAQAELKAKWKDWIPAVTGGELAKYTATRDQFKIMKDPEFPNDTNRVTVQSCCNTQWGYDDIQAMQAHGDAQFHVEFNGMGQYDADENPNLNDAIDENPRKPGYYNSGVYVQSRYEIQVRAFTQTKTTIPGNHDLGGIVDDYAPTANANRPNGQWQAYDITFRSARYDNTGKKLEDARISVWWNGVQVHNNRLAHGSATGIGPDQHSGEPLNATLFGLKLQSEGTDVRYRNIWMKELNLAAAETNLGY